MRKSNRAAFPQHSYLLTFPSTHLCWPVNITHLTAFTHCVLSWLTAERWEMRLQGWVIHPSLGFVVHTRRYKQYGRQGLEAASRQSILLRKSGSISLQLSATVSSISCHTLFSSIACFLLNFYTANGDVQWELFAMFSLLPPLFQLSHPSISLVLHLWLLSCITLQTCSALMKLSWQPREWETLGTHWISEHIS